MPELPEVQTVVTTLQPLVGRRLGTARVLRREVVRGPGDLTRFCRGRTIRAIRRRGKRILFEIGDGRRIQFHLGMTGQLTVKRRRQALLDHTHLRLPLMSSPDELRFRDVRRFGGVWFLDGSAAAEGRGLGPLGPDPLQVTASQFAGLLARKRRIKSLLLDQTALAGLGNIYADESLYKAAVHPDARACDLTATQVGRLYRAIRSTLRAAIRAGGSTISDYRSANGERGWFQLRHQVYGREGRPCRRCKTPIQRIQVAGRSSHVCPKCQGSI